MKLFILAFSLMLTALPGFADTDRKLEPIPTTPRVIGLMAPADPDHFVFALAGDNRSTGRNIPMPPTAGQISTELRLLQPAFTLWTGDCIYGSDDTIGEAEAEYDQFLTAAGLAACPIFNAPGNHEIFNRKEMEVLYERRMGKTFGSFDYGNSHFIALNTEEPGIKSGISAIEKTWLQSDLAANKKAKNIVVWMHHPLFPTEPKEGFGDDAVRNELHKIFVQGGVKNVFSGHQHLYNKSVHDGVSYYISGGAGAPTSGSPENGGYQHFMMLEVNGDKVTPTILQPWRAFVSVGPVGAGGSCSAVASNYNDPDLPFYIEFPENVLTSKAIVTATMTYKSKSEPVKATIVPSRSPGVVTARVVVRGHRSVVINVHP